MANLGFACYHDDPFVGETQSQVKLFDKNLNEKGGERERESQQINTEIERANEREREREREREIMG